MCVYVCTCVQLCSQVDIRTPPRLHTHTHIHVQTGMYTHTHAHTHGHVSRDKLYASPITDKNINEKQHTPHAHNLRSTATRHAPCSSLLAQSFLVYSCSFVCLCVCLFAAVSSFTQRRVTLCYSSIACQRIPRTSARRYNAQASRTHTRDRLHFTHDTTHYTPHTSRVTRHHHMHLVLCISTKDCSTRTYAQLH